MLTTGAMANVSPCQSVEASAELVGACPAPVKMARSVGSAGGPANAKHGRTCRGDDVCSAQGLLAAACACPAAASSAASTSFHWLLWHAHPSVQFVCWWPEKLQKPATPMAVACPLHATAMSAVSLSRQLAGSWEGGCGQQRLNTRAGSCAWQGSH